MFFRLSRKLNANIREGKLIGAALSENPQADWPWHLYASDRTEYLIKMDTALLYSQVMYEPRITDGALSSLRALGMIPEFTVDEGKQFIYRKFISHRVALLALLEQFALPFAREERISPGKMLFTTRQNLQTNSKDALRR